MASIEITEESPLVGMDLERSVLAVVLVGADLYLDPARAILKQHKESFWYRSHKLIWETVCEIADRGEIPTLPTVHDKLHHKRWYIDQGGSRWLAVMADSLFPQGQRDLEQNCRRLVELARVREAVWKANDFIIQAQHLSVAPQELIRGAEASFSELAHFDEDRKLLPLLEVMKEVAVSVNAAIENPKGVTGVATGFKELDAATSGSHDGDLTIIGGRPGMGKSAFAVSIAHNVAKQGYAAPIFSLEMPALQLGLRLVAMDTGLNLKNLRSGKVDRETEWPVILNSISRLAKLPIFIDDTSAINILNIRARLKGLKRDIEAGKHEIVSKGRIGGVFIDYLQLMSPIESKHSREEEVSANSRALKQLAKDLSIPVTVLSQLNRESEKRSDKRPVLSDLRESGAIEQDADNIMFVFRPGYYTRDPEKQNVAEIILAKQRNGPTLTCEVAFSPETTMFSNLERWYDERDERIAKANEEFNDLDDGFVGKNE